MGTREDLIAQIQAEEEAQAIQAELSKRQKPLGDRVLDSAGSLAKAGKTIWDNLARGAGNAVSGLTSQSLERDAPELFPTKSPLGRFSDWVAQDVKEKLPIPTTETLLEKLIRKGTEAVGGGLVMGVPGLAKAPVAGLSALFAGGVGGDLGETAGRNFGGKDGKTADTLGAIGSILGSVAGAVPAGMLLGPRQSNGEAAIRRNSQGLNPIDFQKADENLSLFKRTKAETATLPEAFEGRTSLLGLAENTRASKGGEDLANRTTNRAKDLQGLGNEFLKRVGPEKDPNAVAVQAVDKANAFQKKLENLRSDEFGKTLQGVTISPVDGFSTYRRLMAEARQHPDPDYRVALADVATKFLDEHKKGAPITDVQTLSFRLKRLKENEPSANASTGTVISRTDLKKAVAYAEELLGQISPQFARANQQYEKASGNIEQQMSGGFGRLADKNPVTAAEPTVNRLNPLFSSGSGPATSETIKQLQTPGPTFGSPVAGNDVLRAWAAQRLDKGATNPGGVIRGLEGSSAEERIAAALTASGRNPQQALEPLRAADKLQNFSGLPGMKEPPDISAVSALIRPRRAADFMMTDASRERLHSEIASLMAPTRENLMRLQEIAKFDPAVRRMLIARGIIAPQFAKE